MNFKALNTNHFELQNYSVVPYREQDKSKIKKWRNNQMDVLRQQNRLTDEDQTNYFNHYILPSFTQEKPRILLFSFLENGHCIGYGGLTNIDWGNKYVELSFLLDDERAKLKKVYEKDFSVFISLMKIIVFEELNFNRIFTETYDLRPHHINILEKNGFKLEGRMKEHVFINGKFIDSLIHAVLKKDYDA